MLSRTLSRLVILASIATLAGVSFYFMNEYRSLRQREQVVGSVTEAASADGPCAGLAMLRELPAATGDLARSLSAARSRLVAQVVGEEDVRARRVFGAAERENLIDRPLCEQIRLSREMGEVHPVLSLLRYTREGGGPCDEESRLAETLDGLGSHRPLMLRALLRDVRELACLSPALAEKIAGLTAVTVADAPRLLDDLDVPRIAAFVIEWSPLAARQLACRIEAQGETSSLARAVGCTPEALRRILVHYRTEQALAASGRAPALPAGSDVVLVGETGPFCDVIPTAGPRTLRTVACRSLRLSSDLVLAARIEALSYGRAEADLVAGLGTYLGASGAVVKATREPGLRSWFGYNRDGYLVGAAQRIEIGAIAAMLGEAVPDEPLRAFCTRTGARYCYDVDWAHVVSRLRGEPVLYLSRPASVFLEPAALSGDEAAARFRDAFGREPAPDAYWRVFTLAGGGELVVEAARDEVDLRWRTRPGERWYAQGLGRSEGGAHPPSARLLAALDLQKDGRPELVIQRTTYRTAAASAHEEADELQLLRLSAGSERFAVVNHLTVHEY